MSNPIKLSVRSMDPPGDPLRLVFLHPGIFATPAYFKQLHPFFRERGWVVKEFDPRGLEDNFNAASGPIDKAVRVQDLLDVVGREADNYPDLPIAFLGHSFGGTVIYNGLVQAGAKQDQHDWYQRVDRVVTLASPSTLQVVRRNPWSKLYSKSTPKIVRRHDRGGWISPARFVVAQGQVSTSWKDILLRVPGFPTLTLGVVSLMLFLARRSLLFSWLALKAPVPSTFLRAPGDFTARSFREFLRSNALNRDSGRVVAELIESGLADGLKVDGVELREAYSALGIPTMTVASDRDLLVRPEEAWMSGAKNELLSKPEEQCGHAGYLFKEASRERICELLRGFM